MQHRTRGFTLTLALLVCALCALALVACGGSGSGSQAASLLKQTFGGSHRVDSGNVSFNLTIDPSGSRTITAPLTVSFGGPFQSQGAGKLPQSNFTISASGFGKSGSIAVISTGQSGFVTLQGTSYQMPAATFQTLEKSFAGLTSSASGSSGSGTLTKLGIDPLRWLTKPSIEGDETVAGASTTHIRAGINVPALIGDLGKLLRRASTSGISGASSIPTSISPATATKIANEVHNPRFDVWTGKSDKTIRKLAIALTLPVSGQISTLLGGLRSAQVTIGMQYANLNQPQTIAAPTSLRPFSEFTTKLAALEQSLRSILSGTIAGGGAATTGAGSSGAAGAGATGQGTATGQGAAGSPTPAPNAQRYSLCVQAAGSDVAKMQSCASLLGG